MGSGVLHGVLLGGFAALAVLLIGTYGAALRWGAGAGVILGPDLLPVGFRSPTATWPFTLATGILVATAVLLMLRLSKEPLRAAAHVSSAIAALVGLVTTLVASYFAEGLVQEQPAWQRISSFLSGSESVVVFTVIMVCVSMSRVGRGDRNHSYQVDVVSAATAGGGQMLEGQVEVTRPPAVGAAE